MAMNGGKRVVTALRAVSRAGVRQSSPWSARAVVGQRWISQSPLRLHDDHDHDFVPLKQGDGAAKTAVLHTEFDDDDDEDDEDMVSVVAVGPNGDLEYGGPTHGGKYKEPTRFGDWERKGRCSDF
ncbi:hypothetical protein Poli38472_011623 [Pythium oligandrum]|uniref:Succinate dehydrogenase assembly factor 4, mitochondrial n=1 Tax=Pythium oligandrum TaxID=41045 RepID=A0A8K1CKP8_PYTOL|nr:hypothetical protein Poli38472_011623 [Pythium oligandrum]|eukprot:TMW64743.1 hypothetical protein Poli38472_011623 [Pythium oligandrum]